LVDLSPIYAEIVMVAFAVAIPAIYYRTKSDKIVSATSLIGIAA
jgi:hypothetical protein